MSDDSIFSADPAEPVVPNPAPSITLPQEVAELVGEGKKYKSAEDALKSIPHAQSHISKLEEEMAQMREELAKRKAAEELLEELKSTGFKQEPTTTKSDPVDIEQVVAKVLTQKEAQAKAQENQKQVVKAFDGKYGDKGEEMYVKLAEESGMSVAELNLLAARSPKALFKLAGFESKESVPGKTQSSVNTEGFKQESSNNLSAKVPKGATTKDVLQAWRNAGEKVKQNLG